MDPQKTVNDPPLKNAPSAAQAGFYVGNHMTVPKTIVFTIVLFFVSFLASGFGILTLWISVVIAAVGFLLIFPTLFENHWYIANDKITVTTYSPKLLKKFTQVSGLAHASAVDQVPTSAITTLELAYYTRFRPSPVDIIPDRLVLILHTSDRSFPLEVTQNTQRFLPQLVVFAEKNHLQIDDPDDIITLSSEGRSLYEHFHPGA